MTSQKYAKLPECDRTHSNLKSVKIMALYGTDGHATNYSTTRARRAV